MFDVDPIDDCGCGIVLQNLCGCIQCPRCDDWRSKEDHPSGEFSSSGVCYECTCNDCGKRIDTDDMNDDFCETCLDIAIRLGKWSADGWCINCDEEKEVQLMMKGEWSMNLCLACLGGPKPVRAWDVFIERFGRQPNLEELEKFGFDAYMKFGLELKDEDSQKSPKGMG